MGGLFCERIFGPVRDWECRCGRYRGVQYKEIICDRCGVEVAQAKVRRERMGHITLAAPVSHIWYVKSIPSPMGMLLDVNSQALEEVLYFTSYIVIDAGTTPLMEKQLLTEDEYWEYRDKYGNRFDAGMGAEALKTLLERLNLETLATELRHELKSVTDRRRMRASRRLEVVEAFRRSGNNPAWMILNLIPVLPPDLRPLVMLDGGRVVGSDLNDLYGRVINRNNRLKRLLGLGAPDIIVRDEKRRLQEAVDALIDNGRRGQPVSGPGNRPLRSLSDMIRGKQGRFHQNLLGKRVDYSGRSVIIPGPELRIYQCGLPKKMALELFKPFVIQKLVTDGYAYNVEHAERALDLVKPMVWEVLPEVIQEHPIMLNRAPTLHRLSIQAFEPVLIEGSAIQLHPLVCTGFKADFDGDQMAVHVPLSNEAQAEARVLMLATHNILSPRDGTPIIIPSKDMLLGSYYLTLPKPDAEPKFRFSHPHEALLAYDSHVVGLHDWVKIRFPEPPADLGPGSNEWWEHQDNWGDVSGNLIQTTIGRMIFNQALHPQLRYLNITVDSKWMEKIMKVACRRLGTIKTAELADRIKQLGFRYATQSGVTVALADMKVPSLKTNIVADCEERVQQSERAYSRGLLTGDEQRRQNIAIWSAAESNISKAVTTTMEDFNPVHLMTRSGARGSLSQLIHLVGMRGLVTDPTGKILGVPIKSSLREGMSALEYFTCAQGARKGLADTALRIADSGYLIRRLGDVIHDVIVRENDCGTTIGITWKDQIENGQVVGSYVPHIVGRVPLNNIVHPRTGQVLVYANESIDDEMAHAVKRAVITEVTIRSLVTCRTRFGVCQACYGQDLATGRIVKIGEAVGIIAAQAIGEPAIQLECRPLDTNIRGLPRIEELFEARTPRHQALISDLGGTVAIVERQGYREVTVTSCSGEAVTYSVPLTLRLSAGNGQIVEAGDALTGGPINPHELLRVRGARCVQRYLISELQGIFKLQGVNINDKHIEVVVRHMLRMVKVEVPGDTDLLTGALTDICEFEEENERVLMDAGAPAIARPILLGITKASLTTASFLSAASFQETTRVLTDAAIKGKRDPLLGLNENVIIGKLIPAETGCGRYRRLKIMTEDTILHKLTGTQAGTPIGQETEPPISDSRIPPIPTARS